jgi:hypothetical protein
MKLTHTGYVMMDVVVVSVYRTALVFHVSAPLLLAERWRISAITSSSNQESKLKSPEYEAFLASNTAFCELFSLFLQLPDLFHAVLSFMFIVEAGLLPAGQRRLNVSSATHNTCLE